MILSLSLALLISPYLAAANFAIVFGTPSPPCRSCLQGIYSTCAASNTYSEGQTSDFSNCICGLDSLGEAAVCLTGDCMDLTQSLYINSMYNSWCLTHNAVFRREACAQTGFTRDYFVQYTGEVFTSACEGDIGDNGGEAEDGAGDEGQDDGVGVNDVEDGDGREDRDTQEGGDDDDDFGSDSGSDSGSLCGRVGYYRLLLIGTGLVMYLAV